MRHLIILDFRPNEEFKESHIRKSLNVTMEDYQQKLTEAIAGPKEHVHNFRSHFEGDDIRRVLCVFPSASWK